MEGNNAAAGLAALAICESLLLSLTENKLIDGAEALAILGDAAAAHRNAAALLRRGEPRSRGRPHRLDRRDRQLDAPRLAALERTIARANCGVDWHSRM